jgi:hypothetical protein
VLKKYSEYWLWKLFLLLAFLGLITNELQLGAGHWVIYVNQTGKALVGSAEGVPGDLPNCHSRRDICLPVRLSMTSATMLPWWWFSSRKVRSAN